MKYKEQTIKFLDNISKQCDEEATKMIKDSENGPTEDAIDAVVHSSLIMSVYTQCQVILGKVKSK